MKGRAFTFGGLRLGRRHRQIRVTFDALPYLDPYLGLRLFLPLRTQALDFSAPDHVGLALQIAMGRRRQDGSDPQENQCGDDYEWLPGEDL